MAKTTIKISVPSFHEITQCLKEKGVELSDTDSITLTKDTALERPIDWRLVQVRKDCIIEAAKVYRPRMVADFEVTDSNYFLKFVEDIHNYILNAKMPDEKVLKDSTATSWVSGPTVKKG